MMKFCCDHFKELYLRPNSASPNIRIVLLTSPVSIENDYVVYFKKGKEIKVVPKQIGLKCLFTTGYETFDCFDSRSKSIFKLLIFCPFCGTDLYKFYDKAEYANEVEGKTF